MYAITTDTDGNKWFGHESPGGVSFLVEGEEDTTSPELAVVLPDNGEVFDYPNVTVEGTAYDKSGIYSVTVNGQEAESDDNWQNWYCEVVLSEGSNMIVVTATDDSENRNWATESVTVTYRPEQEREPTIDVKTDKVLYQAGDSMNVEITLGNPGERRSLVRLYVAAFTPSERFVYVGAGGSLSFSAVPCGVGFLPEGYLDSFSLQFTLTPSTQSGSWYWCAGIYDCYSGEWWTDSVSWKFE